MQRRKGAKLRKGTTENEHEHHFSLALRRQRCDDRSGSYRRALRLCAGRISWLPGYFARAAIVAHAFDVSDERYLRHLARRLNRDCRRNGSTSQQGRDDSWFYCCGLFDDERRRRIRDYRSHVEDVQKEEIATKMHKRHKVELAWPRSSS